MALKVTHQLNVCHPCACLIANGEGDPDHDDAATATAVATYGDLLRDLSLSCPVDDDGDHACAEADFHCDYCDRDVWSYWHEAVILG